MYGRDLLEKNLEIESQLEKERQEKHEAQLRLLPCYLIEGATGGTKCDDSGGMLKDTTLFY